MSGSVSIFCRLRPVMAGEQEARFGCRCTSLGDVIMLKQSETASVRREFLVDKLFSPMASTNTIFNHIGKPMVEHVMSGFDSCCLAYGQTGAGKTYTMFGDDGRSGLLSKICRQLFEVVTMNRLTRATTVLLNVVEIYLNNVRDLLSPIDIAIKPEQAPAKDENAQLVTVEVKSVHELLDTLGRALDARTMAETKMNPTSSRSHTIVTLTVKQTDLEKGITVTSKLCTVDLAGSESSTDETNPLRIRESAAINRSLSSLSNVLWCISAGKEHIPYRDSILTRMLQPCLRIDSAVLMLMCVHTSTSCLQESLSTLQFAHRCRIARSQPRIAVGDQEGETAQIMTLDSLTSELMSLKRELHSVRVKRHELAINQAKIAAKQEKEEIEMQKYEAEADDTEETLLRKLSTVVERNNALTEKLRVKTASLKEYNRKMNADIELRKNALLKQSEKAVYITRATKKDRETASTIMHKEADEHTACLENTISDNRFILTSLYSGTERNEDEALPVIPRLQFPVTTTFPPPQVDTEEEQLAFDVERRKLESELARLRMILARLANIGGVTSINSPKELQHIIEEALVSVSTRGSIVNATTLGKSLLKE